MPRASTMQGNPGEKVFYWPDTGPVKAQVKNDKIVSAAAVDPEIEDWEASVDD